MRLALSCDLKTKLSKLARLGRAWRAHHQVLAAVILWESDHIANVFGARREHDQTIHAKRDPAMGRRSKLKRLEKVRKEKLLPVGINAERFEHPGLQIALMNSNAPASDLNAVQDNVVGLRTNLSELACFQSGDIFALGASERVMHGIPFLFLAAVG